MRKKTLVVSVAMLIGLLLIFFGVGTIEVEEPILRPKFWLGVGLNCLGIVIIAWVAYQMRNWRE